MAIHNYEVLEMWGFRKKQQCVTQQDAEQQLRVERVLDAQDQFLALYEKLDKPRSQAAEIAAVKASIEKGRSSTLP